MRAKPSLRAPMLALVSAIAVSTATLAGPEDYKFQLVESEIKQGDGATVAVRLTDKRTGNPVVDAVVFATRMDMQPDGMEAMTTPVEAISSVEPGVYRFRTNLVMAGGWRFSIAAKVQGEAETVESRLVLEAVE
jgi:hypothetical protein